MCFISLSNVSQVTLRILFSLSWSWHKKLARTGPLGVSGQIKKFKKKKRPNFSDSCWCYNTIWNFPNILPSDSKSNLNSPKMIARYQRSISGDLYHLLGSIRLIGLGSVLGSPGGWQLQTSCPIKWAQVLANNGWIMGLKGGEPDSSPMLGTREAAIEWVKTIDFSFQITINITPRGFDNSLNVKD